MFQLDYKRYFALLSMTTQTSEKFGVIFNGCEGIPN